MACIMLSIHGPSRALVVLGPASMPKACAAPAVAWMLPPSEYRNEAPQPCDFERGTAVRKRSGSGRKAVVADYRVGDDGTFPNNERLAILVYRSALPLNRHDEHQAVRTVFEANGWTNVWVDGMFEFNHYHSTSHEVLGFACGQATVEVGGPSQGVRIALSTGDVLLIPAGVAHRKIEGSRDLTVVGAYPPGQQYDMNYGLPEERRTAVHAITQVGIPETDPVLGPSGPLAEHWGAWR